jgi:hypothetical protein
MNRKLRGEKKAGEERRGKNKKAELYVIRQERAKSGS